MSQAHESGALTATEKRETISPRRRAGFPIDRSSRRRRAPAECPVGQNVVAVPTIDRRRFAPVCAGIRDMRRQPLADRVVTIQRKGSRSAPLNELIFLVAPGRV